MRTINLKISASGALLLAHPEPKRMGRPELPPEERTRPRTIWMTDAEWSKVQAAPKGWIRDLVQRAE